MNGSECCGNCRFFQPYKQRYENCHADLHGRGLCRLKPPTQTETAETDWCGQYQAGPDEYTKACAAVAQTLTGFDCQDRILMIRLKPTGETTAVTIGEVGKSGTMRQDCTFRHPIDSVATAITTQIHKMAHLL